MKDILKTDTLNQIFDKTNDNFDELEMMDRTIDSKIDSNKTEVNTSINELNSKIDTTATRINNLVANTGDSNSEIVDARLGNDGTAYSTLGVAIRTQVGLLESNETKENQVNIDGMTFLNRKYFGNGSINRTTDGNVSFNAKTKYRIGIKEKISIPYDFTVSEEEGFTTTGYYFDGDGTSHYINDLAKNPPSKNTPFMFDIRRTSEDENEIADINEFWKKVKFSTFTTNLNNELEEAKKNIEKNNDLIITFGEKGYILFSDDMFKQGRYHKGNITFSNYRVCTKDKIKYPNDLIINTVKDDFDFYVFTYDDNGNVLNNYSTTNGKILINANVPFTITIKKKTEDTSLKADINEFVSSIGIIPQFQYNNPRNDIIGGNEEAINNILASRWTQSETSKPLSLLCFTDIHAWSDPLKRIISFRDYLTKINAIDDTICLGDMVKDNLASGNSSVFENFKNVTGSENILYAIGNHDTYYTGVPHQKATISQKNKIFFTDTSKWGNIIRGDNASYYYKDYEENKIRLIVTDPAITQDESDETSWLKYVLEGARSKGYAVIVVSHYLRCEAEIYDNNWTNQKMRKQGSWEMGYDWEGCDIVSCVTEFITNGGKFICYLLGHKHEDAIGCVKDHKEQLFIIAPSASCDREHETPLSKNDLPRYEGTRTEDAFNVVTVDVENSVLKVIRVGADTTMMGYERKMLTYNFDTHEFIKS